MNRTRFRHRLRLAMIMVALPGLLPPVAGAQPSPEEIASRSLQAFYYSGDDMRVRISMALINSQGRTRRREMTMLRRNFGTDGDQRYFIFFSAPADVRGMTFMVWKYPSRDDDRWIFIPSVKMVRRIAANDSRSSFVGSDFTYEDVSGRDVGDEDHRLLRTEELDGRPTFVLESRPRRTADYARRVSWIDRERWLVLKEEYFDARGERVRVFTADEVLEIGGHWTVTRRTMKNLQSDHRTEVTFADVGYDVGLEEGLFTERYLRNPPRKWFP